jgi:hypothetical protein
MITLPVCWFCCSACLGQLINNILYLNKTNFASAESYISC